MKIKSKYVDMYLINLDNWVFFQSANSNCCKKYEEACNDTFENRQFSRCQVFPKYYLQRPTAMVDRRNTGKFNGSFHSKFLSTLGLSLFKIAFKYIHIGQSTSRRDESLDKMSGEKINCDFIKFLNIWCHP